MPGARFPISRMDNVSPNKWYDDITGSTVSVEAYQCVPMAFGVAGFDDAVIRRATIKMVANGCLTDGRKLRLLDISLQSRMLARDLAFFPGGIDWVPDSEIWDGPVGAPPSDPGKVITDVLEALVYGDFSLVGTC